MGIKELAVSSNANQIFNILIAVDGSDTDDGWGRVEPQPNFNVGDHPN